MIFNDKSTLQANVRLLVHFRTPSDIFGHSELLLNKSYTELRR